jgi:hypothetical protein
MHGNFLNHERYRYLWVALTLCVASITAYWIHDPIPKPNGGTWLGYTLGTIGVLIILWLTWFGVRKRRYSSSFGTLKGWLSAHIYLGTSLIVIALLHAGFQIGWNIHTLALVLMLTVIFSGFFGVWAYLRYPEAITQNRQNATREAMLAEIAELNQQSLQLADQAGPKVHGRVSQSIERTQIGGSLFRQLFPKDASAGAFLDVRRALEDHSRKDSGMDTQNLPTMFVMVDALASQIGSKEQEALRKLVDVLSRKKALTASVCRDIQLKALIDVWLYVHVPITFALLAALIAHVVSVFFYW